LDSPRTSKVRELANEVVTRIGVLAEVRVARDRIGDRKTHEERRAAADALIALLREVFLAVRER
jgi:hypothetical protein